MDRGEAQGGEQGSGSRGAFEPDALWEAMLAAPDLTPGAGAAAGAAPGLGLGLGSGSDSCPPPRVLLAARLLASLVPGQPEPWGSSATCPGSQECPSGLDPVAYEAPGTELPSPAARLLTGSADAFAPARVALAALRMAGAAGDSTLALAQGQSPTDAVRTLAGAAAAAAARVPDSCQRRALATEALQGGDLAGARAALRADSGLRQAVARAMVPAMNRIVAGAARWASLPHSSLLGSLRRLSACEHHHWAWLAGSG